MIQKNKFKQALASNSRQIGLWCALANNVTAEIAAGSGFDWLVIDVEHSPNDLRSVLVQLQAMAPYPVEPVVRLPFADPVLIKQYLDIGARSLLLPNVGSAEQAKSIVAATRYPPHGMRGVSIIQRANRYGRVADYHRDAANDICLVLQIESPEGVQAAADIAAVDGVDALFVGPSDLSASMGHFLRPDMPEIQDAMASILAAARSQNKATGILVASSTDADRYLEQGFTMVGVGSDQGLLVKACDQLALRFKSQQG